jgi:DNA-binding transcriptional LysR family regulator
MPSELSFHLLRVFLQVVNERGISKAAAALNVTQPSVSMQIRKLENNFGVKLIDRLGQEIHPTQEGMMLREYATKILDLVDHLHADMANLQNLKTGRLVVGGSKVPSARRLPLAIAKFQKLYGQTEILMEVASSDQVEQWVLDNHVDFAIIVGHPSAPQVVKEPFYEEELVLVLPPKHPMGKRKQVSAYEISKMRLLLPHDGRVKTYVENCFAAKGIPLNRRVSLGSMDSVKTAIGAGLGVSIMAGSTVEGEVRTGLLVTKRLHDLQLKYPINIIYHKDKHFSRLATAFLTVLKKSI